MVISLFTGLEVWAQEETEKATELESMVVTATRTETLSENIPSSVTVITSEDIERKGQISVYDVLKDVPGLALKQCGGPGQWTSVRMRGGQDRHIKLLINGSAVGDQATGITPHYDLWNMLNTDDIERIEVIRGAQSALYGSDAVSGVINIITKKGKGKPKFFLKAIGGSMDTWKTSGGVNGSQGKTSYNIVASHNEAGGVLPNDKSEDDSVAATFGYDLTEDTDFNLSLQYSDTMVNTGQSSSSTWKNYDDPHAYRYGKLFFSNLDFSQQLTSFWEQKISLGYDHIEKEGDDRDDGILDATDNIKDSYKKSEYVTITKKLYWQNNFFLGEADTLTAGFEYEGVDMDRDYQTAYSTKIYGDSIDTKSLYLQNQILLFEKALSFNLGGRFDDHSAFGSHTTYNVGVSYLLRASGTKLKATYGTGFAAPSIFNLYDPDYGTPELDPEESKSWDVGFEQKFFGEKAIFEATYFHNDFEDLIAYDSVTKHYLNRETAKSYGVETALTVFPLDSISMSLSYTYTDGEEDGKDLANVPKDDWKFNLTYSPGRFQCSLDLYAVGDRLAYDQTEEHRMDSYNLVNLSGRYQVNETVTLLMQLDNLFDEDYQSAAPYDAPGFSAYGGMRVTF